MKARKTDEKSWELPFASTSGARHVKFAQLCFLTLMFQGFAFPSWI